MAKRKVISIQDHSSSSLIKMDDIFLIFSIARLSIKTFHLIFYDIKKLKAIRDIHHSYGRAK